MAQAGRRPGPSQTKEAILAAARAQFADRGFGGTTVRSVAAAAGVNPALIHHYFGNKENLFLATLSLPINPADMIAGALASGPRSEFPERLVRTFVTTWRDPVVGRALQAALRRATSDESGAAQIRNLAEHVVLVQAAEALDIPKARVAAAMSHLIGLALGMTIIGVEPLASAGEDELVALVAPAIRTYLG